jgi:hypothetical protein
MCPGSSYGSIATQGSITNRLGVVPGSTGYLNINAFCPEPAAPNSVAAGPYGVPTLYGNSGIGTILGPGNFNFDISLIKTTHITERQSVIFRAEFFNAFNHPQFSNPVAADLAVSSPSTFGQITTTAVNPRLIQFALKYIF